MKTTAQTCLAATVGAIGLLAPGVGRASGNEPRVTSFEVRVPAECPPQATFVDEVERRTRRSQDGAGDDPDALSFAVRIEATGAGRHRGRLAVTRAAGGSAEREVEGESCVEVMHALALMAALSIDPEGGGREQLEEQTDGAPPARTEAVAPAEPSPETPQPPIVTDERSLALAVGVHAAAQAGVVPSTIFALPVFVELGARRALTSSLRMRVAHCDAPSAVACDYQTYVTTCAGGRPAYCARTSMFGPVCADLGLACVAKVDSFGTTHLCAGTGPACASTSPGPGEAAYDGIACSDPSTLRACVNTFESTRFCPHVAKGFTCQTVGTTSFCGLASECHGVATTCDGNSLVMCNAGKNHKIDCTSLGFAGCVTKPGVSGAVCSPGP